MNEKLRSLCKALAYRHARQREWYVGHEERLTDPVAQYWAAVFLINLRNEWRREKKSLGL